MPSAVTEQKTYLSNTLDLESGGKGEYGAFFSMDYFPTAPFAIAHDSEYNGQVPLNNNSLAGY